jgi:hypothetical protein
MGGAVQPEKITRVPISKAKIANFNDLWIYTRDLLELNIFTVINYTTKLLKILLFFQKYFFREIVDSLYQQKKVSSI